MKVNPALLLKASTILSTVAGFLAKPVLALAQGNTNGQDRIVIEWRPPSQGINPTTSVGVIVSNAVTVVFVIAVLAVLFMLINGAFAWITSGGDKEAVGKARGRILNALIGLVILGVAFVIVRVAGVIVGADFTNLVLPALDNRNIPSTAR